MNVHNFDGKINNTIPKINIETKINYFNSTPFKIIHPNFFTIKNDMITNPNANYDPTNNLYADDILYLILYKLESYNKEMQNNVLLLLNEIFEEMYSGLCPQGRTHRLYQIYCLFQ